MKRKIITGIVIFVLSVGILRGCALLLEKSAELKKEIAELECVKKYTYRSLDIYRCRDGVYFEHNDKLQKVD